MFQSHAHRVIVSALVLSAVAGAARADIATDWNTAVLDAIKTGSTAPPVASRAMAMMHTAMYDANNAVTLARKSYLPIPAAAAGASREAAVAQAAHDVLVNLFPSQAASFDARLAGQLGAIAPGQSRNDGVALGATVASNYIAYRAGDGSTAASPWSQGNTPTSWHPTGPSPFPLFNQYAAVQPWTMTACNQFRQAAPPLPGSPEFQAAYDEVKAYGSATSAVRSADQTEIAKYWAAGGGTVTPPGLWNKIAQTISASQSLSFDQNLLLFAQLNMATADAAICAWDMKLFYDFVRPVTEIRATDDPSWTPLLATPQFQSYSSGHSTFSSAAAAVLASMFGDATAFSLTLSDPSLGLVNVTRSFSSFSAAAAEAGQSRIYGGIHWQFDNTAGLASGAQLGQQVADNFLQVPAPTAGGVALLAGVTLGLRRRR